MGLMYVCCSRVWLLGLEKSRGQKQRCRGAEQGSCNLTRTLAAQAMADWLAGDPTGNGDSDYLITGDLNAYDKEDPIDALLAGADDTPATEDDYVDLVRFFLGHGY